MILTGCCARATAWPRRRRTGHKRDEPASLHCQSHDAPSPSVSGFSALVQAVGCPKWVNRYTGDPAASPAMSAMAPKAEVNSEQLAAPLEAGAD